MTRQQKHINQFLMLIFGSILSAFVIVGSLVYVYGPSGAYKLENVLLSPDLIETLSFSDEGIRQEKVPYKFYDIQWINRSGSKWNKKSVSVADYHILYARLKDSESIKKSEKIEGEFDDHQVSTLVLLMKTHSTIPGLTESMKVFQEVQFIEAISLFRVQVFQANQNNEWAYFKSPLLSTYLEELSLYEK